MKKYFCAFFFWQTIEQTLFRVFLVVWVASFRLTSSCIDLIKIKVIIEVVLFDNDKQMKTMLLMWRFIQKWGVFSLFSFGFFVNIWKYMILSIESTFSDWSKQNNNWMLSKRKIYRITSVFLLKKIYRKIRSKNIPFNMEKIPKFIEKMKQHFLQIWKSKLFSNHMCSSHWSKYPVSIMYFYKKKHIFLKNIFNKTSKLSR